MRSTLSNDEFCVVRLSADKNYFTIIDDRLREVVMDILSGETLEQLEYLDEEDVRDLLAGRSDYEVFGNRELLKKLL